MFLSFQIDMLISVITLHHLKTLCLFALHAQERVVLPNQQSCTRQKKPKTKLQLQTHIVNYQNVIELIKPCKNIWSTVLMDQQQCV